MEFKSRLTSEQIQEILKRHTSSLDFLIVETDELLSKYEGNQLYLLKTPRWRRIGNPFIGKVFETEDGTLITGGFAPLKRKLILSSALCGFFWVITLYSAIHEGIQSVGSDLFFVACLTLWALSNVQIINRLFYKKQQNEVLDFIKEYLQAELIDENP